MRQLTHSSNSELIWVQILLVISFIQISVGSGLNDNLNQCEIDLRPESLDVGPVWEFVRNETGIRITTDYSKFKLVCESSCPINLDIRGHIGQGKFNDKLPLRNIKGGKNDERFTLDLEIPPLSNNGTVSSIVSCYTVDNPKWNKSYSLFGRGRFVHPFVHSGEVLNIINSDVIPCPTTEPTWTVSLKINGTEVGLENGVTYDPVVGFRFPYTVEGNFTCKTGRDSVTIIAEISENGRKSLAEVVENKVNSYQIVTEGSNLQPFDPVSSGGVGVSLYAGPIIIWVIWLGYF